MGRACSRGPQHARFSRGGVGVGPKDLVLGYAGLDRFHSCWTRTGWSRHLCVKDVMRLNTFMPAAIAVEEMFPYSFTAIPKVFILRYRWLRSSPSTSAARVTLPWFSSSFFRM